MPIYRRPKGWVVKVKNKNKIMFKTLTIFAEKFYKTPPTKIMVKLGLYRSEMTLFCVFRECE